MDSECNTVCKLRSLCEQAGVFKPLLDVQDRFRNLAIPLASNNFTSKLTFVKVTVVTTVGI